MVRALRVAEIPIRKQGEPGYSITKEVSRRACQGLEVWRKCLEGLLELKTPV